jgi:hypothetical protein
LGALTGLGGGVVIVPLLTLGFGVDLRYAIGASLISVIATSSGAAAAYVKEGFINLRVGMFLEIATTSGALAGAWVATRSPTATIAVVFGCVLLFSAYQNARKHAESETAIQGEDDPIAHALRLDGSYPVNNVMVRYRVRHVPLGFALMFVAGLLSAMLGIGSGAVKVLAMDRAMALPFRVSTTTSNFMIGVTAAASAGYYLRAGYIDPGLALPVVLGVGAGAFAGSKILPHASIPMLRQVFTIVIAALGVEMLYQGLAGKI